MAVPIGELKLSAEQEQEGRKILHGFRSYMTKKKGVLSQLTWMTGCNGKFLMPGIMRTGRKLIPTGQLLERKIAPLAGTFDAGIDATGKNQTSISGVIPINFADAWDYASRTPFNLSLVKREQNISKEISELLKSLTEQAEQKTLDEAALNNIVRLNLLILQLRQLNDLEYKKLEGQLNILSLMLNVEENWPCFVDQTKTLAIEGLIFPVEKVCENGKLHPNQSIRDFLKEKGISDTLKWRYIPPSSWVDQLLNRPETLKRLLEEIKAELQDDFVIQTQFKRRNLPAYLCILKLFDTEGFLNKNKIDAINKVMEKDCANVRKFRQLLAVVIREGSAFSFSKEERDWMDKVESCPLVLAAICDLKRMRRNGHTEYVVDGCLRLGKELQVVITNKQNLHTVRTFLSQHKVRKAFVFTNEEYLSSTKKTGPSAS